MLGVASAMICSLSYRNGYWKWYSRENLHIVHNINLHIQYISYTPYRKSSMIFWTQPRRRSKSFWKEDKLFCDSRKKGTGNSWRTETVRSSVICSLFLSRLVRQKHLASRACECDAVIDKFWRAAEWRVPQRRARADGYHLHKVTSVWQDSKPNAGSSLMTFRSGPWLVSCAFAPWTRYSLSAQQFMEVQARLFSWSRW